jgi:cytochrome c oxidase subunit 2
MNAQSPLAPRGVEVDALATLMNVVMLGGGIVFAIVLVVTALALRKRPRPAWLGERALIVGGGIVFPSIVLVALLAGTFAVGHRLDPAQAGPLRIAVTGEMWWWRVVYLTPRGERHVATANELHVPAGVPVEVRIATADVIHSLWIPGLAPMLDAIPGRENVMRFTARTPGALRGQCTEYCGLQHANMTLAVQVHDRASFDAWLAAQEAPAAAPATDETRLGQRLFVAHCGACHAVRGTTADGTSGPDLTHVGSRRRVAGTAFPVNAGTLAGWIASSQHLKPGNAMPSFETFSGPELIAVARYVEGLR